MRNGTRRLRVNAKLIKTLLLMLLLTGCYHPRLNNSQRLINRPDFPAATQAAPEWVRDALKTINSLEYELERQ